MVRAGTTVLLEAHVVLEPVPIQGAIATTVVDVERNVALCKFVPMARVATVPPVRCLVEEHAQAFKPTATTVEPVVTNVPAARVVRVVCVLVQEAKPSATARV